MLKIPGPLFILQLNNKRAVIEIIFIGFQNSFIIYTHMLSCESPRSRLKQFKIFLIETCQKHSYCFIYGVICRLNSLLMQNFSKRERRKIIY